MSIEVKISKKPITYKKAMLFLNKRVDEVKNGKKRELLWILEHPTTYTAGVSFNKKDILNKNIKVIKTNRGGKICLAAFPHDPIKVNIPHMVINNIYMYGIRGEGKSATHRAMAFMKQKRFNAKIVHTHTFKMNELPTALKYAKERIDGAIKVVIKPWE